MWKVLEFLSLSSAMAYAAETGSSLTEHSDVLEKLLFAIGGISYSIAMLVLAWVINQILDLRERTTKIETRCMDIQEEKKHRK